MAAVASAESTTLPPPVDVKGQQRALLEAMMHLNSQDEKFKDLAKEDQKKKAIEHLATKGITYVDAPAASNNNQSKAQQQNDEQKAKKDQQPKQQGGGKKEEEAPQRDPNDPNKFPMPGKGKKRQTWPEPTVPVRQQWDIKKFPTGQILPHFPLELNAYRTTSEEKRALERMPLFEQRLFDLRQAAEVHRQVRTWAHTWIAPGMPLIVIADRIEKKLEELIVKDGIKRGQAFPTGVNLNHIAAHYTANTGDTMVLQQGDVMKVDFGTQINGHIIDSAWSVHFDSVWDPLVEATRAATTEGIRQAGIDARLNDIGAAIQEVMESYEVEVGGKTLKVKSIKNLSGHSIDPYIIHAGKSVPIVASPQDAGRMEEGELFAIETFGSTGKGVIFEDLECSHYMALPGAVARSALLRSEPAKALLKQIDSYFSTLAFCRKWLDNKGHTKHTLALKQLVDAGLVNTYPPLCDVKGSMTSQSEHTLILKPTGKEILSKGEDY